MNQNILEGIVRVSVSAAIDKCHGWRSEDLACRPSALLGSDPLDMHSRFRGQRPGEQRGQQDMANDHPLLRSSEVRISSMRYWFKLLLFHGSSLYIGSPHLALEMSTPWLEMNACEECVVWAAIGMLSKSPGREPGGCFRQRCVGVSNHSHPAVESCRAHQDGDLGPPLHVALAFLRIPSIRNLTPHFFQCARSGLDRENITYIGQ